MYEYCFLPELDGIAARLRINEIVLSDNSACERKYKRHLNQLPYPSPANFSGDESHSPERNAHGFLEQSVVGANEANAFFLGAPVLVDDEEHYHLALDT